MAGGLLNMFGQGESELAGWLDPRRNMLMGLGAGMIGADSPRDAMRNSAMGMVKGRQADNAYQTEMRKQEEAQAKLAEAEAQKNRTMQFLQQNAPEFFSAVEAGVLSPADAWAQATAPKGGGAPFTLSPGQVRYGPNGEVIAQGGETPEKPTSLIREYEYAKSQGYEGTLQEYQVEQKKAGASNVTMNANQGTAAAYADRMSAADRILNDPSIISAQTDIVEQGKAGIPVVGNFVTSKEKQMADQAQRDFINAILRRESGAVISPSEFQNAAQQYFPQPGDSPEVIAQKAANRKLALEGVARAAGPTYQAPSVVPPAASGAGEVVDFSDYF